MSKNSIIIKQSYGNILPDAFLSWNESQLPDSIMREIREANYEYPTPI